MHNEADKSDDLDENYKDKLIAIGKGVAGAIPYAGGVIGEVIATVIPGQRTDRVVTYLRALAARVDELTQDVQDELASNVEKIDLIEEGGYQSARATSQQRLDQIVEAVSRGLNEDEASLIRRKRLLQTLGELDDDEVNLLNAYGRSYAGADRQAFDKVNRPSPSHLRSSEIDREENQLYEAGKAHLVRLGLLRKNFGTLKKGEQPEFDVQTGDYKHRLEISYLGRMFLKEIGLATPFDQQRSVQD